MRFIDKLIEIMLQATHEYSLDEGGMTPDTEPLVYVGDEPTLLAQDKGQTVYGVQTEDPATGEPISLRLVVDLGRGEVWMSNGYNRVSKVKALKVA